ncbi:MAG: hypothetical protein FJ206_06525 [Gemmatimonadetes bacterium]|nr:hypothetical protein [Gemmatimonadota bacterium]
MTGRRGWGWAWLAAAAVSLSPGGLSGQDSVIVIRPTPATGDTARGPSIAPEVVERVLAWYNDSTTLRFNGSTVVPAGSRLVGRVAVYRGTLRVLGRIEGPVAVINGDLVVGAGGTVVGDVLVVGGVIDVRRGGALEGEVTSYEAAAPVARLPTGLLTQSERRRALGEIASAQASFRTGRVNTTLTLETGRTYNRIEGLPIVFGPSLTVLGTTNVDARFDLRGTFRPVSDQTRLRDAVGFAASTELAGGGPPARRWGGFGAQAYRKIVATDDQPLGRGESGWSAFLLQRDYRDHYEARGVAVYGFLQPTRGLRLTGALRRDLERSVPASDPVSLFRNDATWRPNPLIDDGHFRTLRFGIDYDTRDDVVRPSTGWLIHLDWEQSSSSDASPVSLPAEVRPAIAPGDYRYSKLAFDIRRYARFNPTSRVNLRILGGGWLGGDPLPVQRRLALGGPDVLPGLPFRALNCRPAGFEDNAETALCERMLAIQLEVRTPVPVALPFRIRRPEIALLQQILGIEQAELVLMGNAGKAWLTGEGPGRVPNNRIPKFNEWDADIGVGLDSGGLGLYLAKAADSERGLRFTVRLQRRF